MVPHSDRDTSVGSDVLEEKKSLMKRLTNQKILVPDILSLMPGWRCDLQPDIDTINEEIDEWLKTLVCFS
jgi:hypothetical protein